MRSKASEDGKAAVAIVLLVSMQSSPVGPDVDGALTVLERHCGRDLGMCFLF